jgi:hypothetical protein
MAMDVVSTGSGYHVADWWLVPEDTQAKRIGGAWVLTTKREDKLIEIVTHSYDATDTPHDPELRDRESLHPDDRRSYF